MYVSVLLITSDLIFLNRHVPAAGRHMPGFLKLILSVNVCMHVFLHVCPPQGY